VVAQAHLKDNNLEELNSRWVLWILMMFHHSKRSRRIRRKKTKKIKRIKRRKTRLIDVRVSLKIFRMKKLLKHMMTIAVSTLRLRVTNLEVEMEILISFRDLVAKIEEFKV